MISEFLKVLKIQLLLPNTGRWKRVSGTVDSILKLWVFMRLSGFARILPRLVTLDIGVQVEPGSQKVLQFKDSNIMVYMVTQCTMDTHG